MSEYKIESGIESPDKGKNNHYPFRAMQIGQSFVFPSAELFKVLSAASYFKIRNPEYRFKTKRIQETNTHRIWRVEAIKENPLSPS